MRARASPTPSGGWTARHGRRWINCRVACPAPCARSPSPCSPSSRCSRSAPAGTPTRGSPPAPTPGRAGARRAYLNVGPLIYQVQVSRELNPANIEDAAYLKGLTPPRPHLAPGQEWFAVFIQVYNNTSLEHQAANNLTISDTQNNTYSPIVPDAEQPIRLSRRPRFRPRANSPCPARSTADVGAPRGRGAALQDPARLARKPALELKIVDPTDASQTASAELDV